MDVKEIHKEKSRCGLLKNTIDYFMHTLELTSHEIAAVLPLTSYHQNNTSKTCRKLLEKKG